MNTVSIIRNTVTVTLITAVVAVAAFSLTGCRTDDTDNQVLDDLDVIEEYVRKAGIESIRRREQACGTSYEVYHHGEEDPYAEFSQECSEEKTARQIPEDVRTAVYSADPRSFRNDLIAEAVDATFYSPPSSFSGGSETVYVRFQDPAKSDPLYRQYLRAVDLRGGWYRYKPD